MFAGGSHVSNHQNSPVNVSLLSIAAHNSCRLHTHISVPSQVDDDVYSVVVVGHSELGRQGLYGLPAALEDPYELLPQPSHQ